VNNFISRPCVRLSSIFLLIAFAWVLGSAITSSVAQEPLAQPPADQTFVGSATCGSCHFEPYIAWKKTKHAKAFEILPDKYREDSSCLECHTTGYGERTGYQGPTTPQLVGVSCEACHGPSSQHVEACKPFTTKLPTKQQETYLRSTIHKVPPANACVKCHLPQAHKKHPDYDK
jgi:cytochrome c553